MLHAGHPCVAYGGAQSVSQLRHIAVGGGQDPRPRPPQQLLLQLDQRLLGQRRRRCSDTISSRREWSTGDGCVSGCNCGGRCWARCTGGARGIGQSSRSFAVPFPAALPAGSSSPRRPCSACRGTSRHSRSCSERQSCGSGSQSYAADGTHAACPSASSSACSTAHNKHSIAARLMCCSACACSQRRSRVVATLPRLRRVPVGVATRPIKREQAGEMVPHFTRPHVPGQALHHDRVVSQTDTRG